MRRLSNRVLKALDRQHGAYLVLPWPSDLPAPRTTLGLDEERPATQREHLAAVRIVAPIARAYNLVHLATVVARLRRPGAEPEAQRPVSFYLLAQLVTPRWQPTSVPGRPGPAVWALVTGASAQR